MYSIWHTFYGIPLTQLSKPIDPALEAVRDFISEGNKLGDDPEDYLSDDQYTDQAKALLQILYTHSAALSDLKVGFHTAYSGSGETPVWIGVESPLPHYATFEATKLDHARVCAPLEQQTRAAHVCAALMTMTTPSGLWEVIGPSVGFWAMHSTS